MKPLMSFALAHLEQPPLHHLEGVGLQVDQATQLPILRCRQRTVLIGRVPARGTRLPIEAPVGHMGLERDFKGWDQLLKLRQCETGQIKHLSGAILEIGEP
jgi:hypothetical protein